MPRQVTRGFSDTAKSGREGALRGAPAIGSPAAGIREQNSFDWLNSIEDFADNATGVINAVKGQADPKPAASIQKPTAVGGLNPQILYIGGAVVLVIVAVLMFKRK